MTIYITPRNRALNVWQNQAISYEFRVVEHFNDEGKVTKYVMQTQVWAHEPPNDNGVSPPPNLVQDWKDVPRVQSINGMIQEPHMTQVVNKPQTANTYIGLDTLIKQRTKP